MLTDTLTKTINILNELINTTLSDIENIKLAKHDDVFANIEKKERLAMDFHQMKSEIDGILVSRNKPLEEIFSDQEEILFNEFREKLITFNTLHKKFSKLAISVANFYNTLFTQIQHSQSINYHNETYNNSKMTLKA